MAEMAIKTLHAWAVRMLLAGNAAWMMVAIARTESRRRSRHVKSSSVGGVGPASGLVVAGSIGGPSGVTCGCSSRWLGLYNRPRLADH